MEYTKPPISIEEQIKKLQNRGLQIDNATFATNFLKNVSYYRLRGYTFSFQNKDTKQFNFAISFEEIVALYNFDAKLRAVLLSALSDIEISFRTNIIYNFSIEYNDAFWYLDKKFFLDKYKKKHSETLENLNSEINRSNEKFVEHYREKYSKTPDFPAWIALEVASFGILSKLYKQSKNTKFKKKIAKQYGIMSFDILENWLQCLTNLRNICAHHCRTWNRSLKPISILKSSNYIEISRQHNYKHTLYVYICTIKYLLSRIDEGKSARFDAVLSELMENCPLNQRKAMGFPDKI